MCMLKRLYIMMMPAKRWTSGHTGMYNNVQRLHSQRRDYRVNLRLQGKPYSERTQQFHTRRSIIQLLTQAF